MRKIILSGYMGSGKSTVGLVLANMLGLPHLDLDKAIEAEQGLSIAEIFIRKGEIFFRKAEHRMLAELIKSDSSFVLSLGGGTPCYSNNHELLTFPNIDSVYLKASIETLASRLQHETYSRPLLRSQNTKELREFIAKHLFDRSYYYNQSKFIVTVDGKNIQQIATEIVKLLA